MNMDDLMAVILCSVIRYLQEKRKDNKVNLLVLQAVGQA
jgi:hypothetical protein